MLIFAEIKKNLKINRVKEEKPIKEECVFESEDGFQLPQVIHLINRKYYILQICT